MNANDVGRDPPNSGTLDHLLTVIQDDIRHVHVRITAAIGIAAVFATQIPLRELRGQPGWAQWLTVLGIVLLALAAAAYFQYTQQLNKLRLTIVGENLATGIGNAAVTWQDQFTPLEGFRRAPYRHARDVWLFQAGQVLLLAGSICVGVVLGNLIVFE